MTFNTVAWYEFCGWELLFAYLRPSDIDAAKHSRAVLKLLVGNLRAAWPVVKITVRGDSGFCRWRLMRWCDSNGIGYVLGLAKNAVLPRESIDGIERAERQFGRIGEPQRIFGSFSYAASSWDRPRRVIAKAEHIGLFADRTSCHRFFANQFRLLLGSAAYVLMQALRREGLRGTELTHAQVGTLRLRLLKVAARVVVSARLVVFQLSSGYPYGGVFREALDRLMSRLRDGLRRLKRRLPRASAFGGRGEGASGVVPGVRRMSRIRRRMLVFLGQRVG